MNVIVRETDQPALFHYAVHPSGQISEERSEASALVSLHVGLVGENTIARQKSARAMVQALVGKYDVAPLNVVGFTL